VAGLARLDLEKMPKDVSVSIFDDYAPQASTPALAGLPAVIYLRNA
jgi:hypothetical protein